MEKINEIFYDLSYELITEKQAKQRVLDLFRVMPPLFNFKDKRKEKGLTLRQVEDLTGISNSYLSQLETGKVKKPSYEVVSKLYNLYNGA